MALDLLTVILLSVLPISELRGAIPYGIIIANLNPVLVFLTAVVSNIIIIPTIFVFLDYVHQHLMGIRLYNSLFGKLIERTQHKAQNHISKYGYLGLVLLVAIPLPITGAYTGTLAAWLFNMKRKKSLLALSFGVVIAGSIVTALVLSGIEASIFLNNRLIN